MSYRIFKINRALSCCVSYSAVLDESFPDPIPNPLLLAQVLACGRPVVELADGVAPVHTHGESPVLLWDIREQVRGVDRLFAWTDEHGTATYMGAQRVEGV